MSVLQWLEKTMNGIQWLKWSIRDPGRFCSTLSSHCSAIQSQQAPSPPSLSLSVLAFSFSTSTAGTLEEELSPPAHPQSALVNSDLISIALGRPTIIITWRQDACGCNITLFRLISSIPSVKSLSIIEESMCATQTAEINPNYSPLPARFFCANGEGGTCGVPALHRSHGWWPPQTSWGKLALSNLSKESCVASCLPSPTTFWVTNSASSPRENKEVDMFCKVIFFS